MTRIAIIGNSTGGKSTLAASRLADRLGLPLIEVDKWQKGVNLIPSLREHAKIIAQDKWVLEGLGHQDSIAERLARSTEI